MANKNAFFPYATATGANVEAPGAWAADPIRFLGFVAGIASSAKFNAALRQASVPSAMLAQFVADYGPSDVNDDGDLSALEAQFVAALTQIILQKIPPFPAFPTIPTYGATEGVKDVNGVFSLNLPGLAEEDTLNAADLVGFYQAVTEGGLPAGQHRKTTFGNLAQTILALLSSPDAPIQVALAATPASFGYFTLPANQSVQDNVTTVVALATAGNPPNWGSCAGTSGQVTISKDGLYIITAFLNCEVGSTDPNQGAFFGVSIAINGISVNTQALDTALPYYVGGDITCSWPTYLKVGDVVTMLGYNHAGNYDAYTNLFKAGSALAIGKIG